MKPVLRRWRGILIALVLVFLSAELFILHVNQNWARLVPVRIHHDESTYSPWLVVRVENPHLTPIRIRGLGPERNLPWAAHQFENDLHDGTARQFGTGWCTSSYCIAVPPLSSREVMIPYDPKLAEKSDISWMITLWSEDSSLLSSINPWGWEKQIHGFYSSRDKLPVTGDPAAKERAEIAERNACCGGSKEKTEDPGDSLLP